MTNTGKTKGQRIKLEVLNLDRDKKNDFSWQRSRKLKGSDALSKITPEQLYNSMLKLDEGKEQALMAILYLTGARVEEIVMYQKIRWGKKRVQIVREGYASKNAWVQDYKNRIKVGDIKLGVTRQDIKRETIKNIDCVVIRIRTLKNRKKHSRSIPIRLDREYNKRIYNLLERYVNTLLEQEELFKFGIRNAERILAKVDINPHSLRDLRLTHLVRYENYSDQLLKEYAGWTDSRPSANYIHLTYEDLIK